MPHLDPPEPVAMDRVHTVVKAAVSAVPYVGGPAAELFGAIVPTSLERRRQEWFKRVADRLRRLEEQDVHIDADDEGFITIVVEATKAALGTHIEEKLELLANCVESAALPEQRDDFMAMRLLLYVEELSPEHFVVLTYAADPEGWFDGKGLAKPTFTMGSSRHVLDAAQLDVQGDVLEIVLRDLADRGLADTLRGGTMTAHGAWQPLTTDLGRLLLKFVQLMDD
ncbi:MAG: hypothetical protein ACRD0W_01385 [Acidimicrobiales bacterium]